MKNNKRVGTIEAERAYNDNEETELAFDFVNFRGFRVALPHPLAEDRPDEKGYISVETPDGHDVYVYPDRIQIYDEAGNCMVDERLEELGVKCNIARSLAAVNRWGR